MPLFYLFFLLLCIIFLKLHTYFSLAFPTWYGHLLFLFFLLVYEILQFSITFFVAALNGSLVYFSTLSSLILLFSQIARLPLCGVSLTVLLILYNYAVSGSCRSLDMKVLIISFFLLFFLP